MLNQILIFGIIVVNVALLFYSIAIIREQKHKQIVKTTIVFLTLGLLCDITATVLMIIGSKKIPITIHGLIGYSALLAMLVDTVLIWKYWINDKKCTVVNIKLHLYTRYAYCWWIIAYIAGIIISFTIKN